MNIPIDPREKRNELGLNQTKFWGAIGVKQSCGSRWENCQREMPEHAAVLLYLATAREEKAIAELRAIRMKMRGGI